MNFRDPPPLNLRSAAAKLSMDSDQHTASNPFSDKETASKQYATRDGACAEWISRLGSAFSEHERTLLARGFDEGWAAHKKANLEFLLNISKKAP
jgi:hypothetical protein